MERYLRNNEKRHFHGGRKLNFRIDGGSPLFSSVDKKLRSLFCSNERLSIRKMVRSRKGNETKNEEKRTTKKKLQLLSYLALCICGWRNRNKETRVYIWKIIKGPNGQKV